MTGHLPRAVRARRQVIMAALAALLLLGVAGAAQARVVWRHGHAYGELPKPGLPGTNAQFTGSPFTVGGNQPLLTYHGGPVMLSSKIYLIFWGPSGSFASSYSGPITQYAKDLAADHLKTSNEFSAAELYYSGTTTRHQITNNIAYGGAVFDTKSYGAIDTAGGCLAAEAPCVTDDQMQNEILNVINAHGWPTDPPNAPEAQYLVFTPKGVNSCDGPGSCTFSANNGYCAYHSQITGLSPGNEVATYANMPYEPGCDSGQAPSGTAGNPDTDGTLDSGIHELVEAATDPNGNAWTDVNGQEIGDKCTNPVVTSRSDIYGTVLGGLIPSNNAYNQLINTHTYYTQQMWANAPTKTPSTTSAAGCVQRIGPSPSFAISTTRQAGVPVTFNGKASTDILHTITTYSWNFGDGSTGLGVSTTHTYAAAGTYQVRLSVGDGLGSPTTQVRSITVSG